jgi:two-component system, cell cycle response regulator DivK
LKGCLLMKKLVLIIDDDEKSRKLCRDVLEIKGFATHLAANGLEGIAAARALIPAVILLDIRMPIMDGITALRALKDYPETRTIPVIILTASATILEQNLPDMKESAAYLIKPIHVVELEKIVSNLAGKSEVDTPSEVIGGSQ